MGSTADIAGVGPTITHKGKAYRVSPVTPTVIGKFEVWLEERGDQYLARYATRHTPAETQAEADRHRRDCITDVYAHGSPEFRRMAAKDAGLMRVLLICLEEANGGDPAVNAGLVKELFDEQPREVARVLQAIDWAVFKMAGDEGEAKTTDAAPAG